MQKLRRLSERQARGKPRSSKVGSANSDAGVARDHGRPPDTSLSVSRHHGRRADVKVLGVVDESVARRFAQQMTALADERVRSVVVDLGGAEVSDPAAFSALAAGLMAAQGSAEVVLKAPRSSTLTLLHRAGLSDAFPVY